MKKAYSVSIVVLLLSGLLLGCPPTKPAVTEFAIENGVATTTARTVTLHTACSESPTQYMVSESPTFEGAVWLPFACDAHFTLSPGDGTKRIYVKVRNDGGESEVVCDEIVLNEVALPTVDNVRINNGDASTFSRQITVTSTCSGVPNQFMISESPTFTGAAWREYVASSPFVLSPGNGEKAVYLKVRNSAGESTAASDTIALEEVLPPVLTSFTIDAGATMTTLRRVTLANTCTGNPTEYSASESPSFSGAGWLPYAPTASFDLSEGEGTKTVYFRVRNIAGHSAAMNASVILVQAPEVTNFSINSGATVTNARLVTLRNQCTGTPTHYMVSESQDFSGARWQNYVGETTFTLSPGSGDKTVYLKVKNTIGESPVASAAIALALPPTITAFSVNNGDATTITRSVRLNNACTEQPTEYLASESPSFAGALWQPYSTEPQFTLAANAGVRTVYFKVRNRVSETAIASDTITLIVPPTVTAFKLDGGAATTTTGVVALNNTCVNAPDEYMASESREFTGAAWLPYANAPTFRLSQGNTTKTVYFKTRNAAGESPATSDSIGQTLPPAVSSFSLENGAPHTASQSTTLDNTCINGPTHYMASESESFAGAAWQTYTTHPAFALSAGQGEKTVHFKVRNAYGASASATDTITYLPPPVVNVFVINTGGAKTTSRVVTLNNTCTGSPTHYMASQSQSFNGATWQPFSRMPEFTLSAGDGEKTVYFKTKNEAGESVPVTDTITLNEVAVVHTGYVFDTMWPMFWLPNDVAFDPWGTMYVADPGSCRIRKFAPDGNEVAGWGSVATRLGRFDCPVAVAANQQGNVYVVDGCNGRVLEFLSDGTPVTAWGSGGDAAGLFDGPSDLALDSEGNVYVADSNNRRIQKFTPEGLYISQWSGEAQDNSLLGYASGIAIDSNDVVYVCTPHHYRIATFTTDGEYLASFGDWGTGPGQFGSPTRIALDPAGHAYVVDAGLCMVSRFTSGGTFEARWSNRGTRDFELGEPQGIAATEAGNVVVADIMNGRVTEFGPAGEVLTAWGRSRAGYSGIGEPMGLAVDAQGNAYVLDSVANRVIKFDATGEYSLQWGGTGSGAGQFDRPAAVAVSANGRVYVTDALNRRVQVFDANGTYIAQWGTVGTGDGQFNGVSGIAVDAAGNVYVADPGNRRMQKFDSTGTFLTAWYGTVQGSLGLILPAGVAIDTDGSIRVTDNYLGRVFKFSPAGTLLSMWTYPGDYNSPNGLAIDGAGSLYVADPSNHRIVKLTSDGTILAQWGTQGAGFGQFNEPRGIAVDASGRVFVADTRNSRVQIFRPE